jgi:hypothetical protein
MPAPRFLALALVVALFIASAGGAAAETENLPSSFPSATPVASADAAVQEAVQMAGGVYAGDCANATPANYGQICSKYVAQQGAVDAYMTGRPFAEFDTWLFIEQTPGGWLPLSAAPIDQSATSISIPWPAG